MSFAQPVFVVVSAIVLALPTERYWLARLAVSVFLCGYAIRWISVDQAWRPLRDRLRVNELTGVRIAMMLYAAAGVPAAADAILYLPTAGAAIFCALLFAWSAGWVWALRAVPREES